MKMTDSDRGHSLTSPYWWEFACPGGAAANVQPAHADVAIVGAGYTGLSAALTIRLAFRHRLHADIAGGAAAIVNKDLLAPRFGLDVKSTMSDWGRQCF